MQDVGILTVGMDVVCLPTLGMMTVGTPSGTKRGGGDDSEHAYMFDDGTDVLFDSGTGACYQ